MRKRVDLRPVLVVFLVAFLALGLGAVLALPIPYVLGAFLLVLVIAFVVLVRSTIRR
jgi:uncharacterized membrane protein AbrB (regulator of aidB expression)